jgi:hypothetical protein
MVSALYTGGAEYLPVRLKGSIATASLENAVFEKSSTSAVAVK